MNLLKPIIPILIGLASPALADSQKFFSWEFYNDESIALAFTLDQSENRFGIGCTNSETCKLFIETNECNEGKPYVVMVSSMDGHTIIPTECAVTELTKSQRVLEIMDNQRMFNFMNRSANFIVAVPHNDGSITLSNFDLHGSAEAMLKFGEHEKSKDK
jgi:hypothetical protein